MSGFRGAPNELSVSCCDASGTTSSVVVLGDNGTGKSTVADAIEFCLQGRVNRSAAKTGDQFRSLFATNAAPSVTITFDDGSETTRSFTRQPDGRLTVDATIPHDHFVVSPVTFRRSDILQFWGTDPLQRLAVFSDFLRSVSAQQTPSFPPSQEQVRKELLAHRQELKQQRLQALDQLAGRLGVDRADIPVGQHFDNFAIQHVFGGMKPDRCRLAIKRGIRLPIDEVAAKLVEETRALNNKIRTQNQKISNLQNWSQQLSGVSKKRLVEVATRIAEDVDSAFRQISPCGSFVKEISLAVAEETPISLQVSVWTHNRQWARPEDVFSEANLDLLAFLLHLGFSLESSRHGQAKVLVLDDVLQSVDAVMRLRAFEWMVRRLDGWQFIVTAHERLWAEQLQSIFRRGGQAVVMRSIHRWAFEDGPVFASSSQPVDRLRSHLEAGDISSICGSAGLLLEQTANELSYTLPVSVVRRRGDKYTLGNLWPPIHKKLKKTTVADQVNSVDRWVHLRSLLGAHYNEWAQSLALHEAREFAVSVADFVEAVQCSMCSRWVSAVEHNGKTIGWRCHCGALHIEYTVAN